ncbi:hypothetical protein ACFY8O_15090 [Streptomyces argenteolus]|uniref:Uncharacterized protein n=1 Tax=Streptomyces argenteolus TaxID=67274 RepID=A0ABW6X7R4_9ACTN
MRSSSGTGIFRPERAPGKGLAVHCLAFCDSLRTHHSGEEGAFTDFEKQFPQLAP